MPFTKLGLSDQLVQGILATGYSAPTVIQSRVIPLALSGHDIIGCAHTGTGKTAAFVLPILHHLTQRNHQHTGRPVRTLVLVPTRELAQQVDEFVKMYGRFTNIQSLAIYGGVSMENQVKRLHNGVDIVAATPGRLLDHLYRKTVNLSSVEILVLDEADRMFDMGFINDVRKIIGRIPTKRQTMLFSATIPKEVKELTASIQRHPQIIEIGEQRKPVESVTQHFFAVPQNKKLELLLHILRTKQLDSVLVFSRTKHGADRISHKLERSGIKSVALHSDRTQAQRQRALAGFKQGQYQVLVATDIAARGIDVEGISHVINYDTPNFAEDYVHRVGRTGRAAATGDAFTFVSNDEQKNLRDIERFVEKKFSVKEYAGFDYSMRPAEKESPQIGHRQSRTSHQTVRHNQHRHQTHQRKERQQGHPHDEKPRNFEHKQRTKYETTQKSEISDNNKDWKKVVNEIEAHGGLTKKLRRWFKKK